MQIFGGGDEFLTKSKYDSTRVGLNLIKGSALDNASQSSWDTSGATANWSDHLTLLQNDVLQNIYVTPNTTYTFSFMLGYLDTTASDTGFYFVERKDNNTNTDPYKDNKYTFATGKIENAAGLHTFSFTTGAECNLLEMHIRYIGSNPNGFQIWKVKLEKGDAATTWCPAIQDFVMKSDKVLTVKNLIQTLFSDELVNIVDDSFDMDTARPGIYRSWGKKPINAPNNCVAWAKYFVIPFIEGNSASMFQVAIDTNGNMFTRVKGGSPANWNSWRTINLGG